MTGTNPSGRKRFLLDPSSRKGRERVPMGWLGASNRQTDS